MNFIEYSPLALRTVKPHEHKHQVAHAQLGLLTELGELCDTVKKFAIYSKPLDKINLVEEIGDCLWYLNLYMIECHVATSLVDEIFFHTEITANKAAQAAAAELLSDPFKLAEFMVLLGGLFGALAVPQKERNVSDFELVSTIFSLFSVLVLVADSTPSEVMTKNIDKLALRYGEKYSDYRALNRDTAAEQELLGKTDEAAS